MVTKLYGATLSGCEPHLVEIEVDISPSALPTFNIVGLADLAIRESKERIRNALKNSGFTFPADRITVNLAPADLKKEGSHLDLGIAVAIVAEMSRGKINTGNLCFLGELALDGRLRKIRGVLPLVLKLKDLNIKGAVIPYNNRKESSIARDVDIYPVRNLKTAVQFLMGEETIQPVEHHFPEQSLDDISEDRDFSQIRGQVLAKRALEIAAAGSHNVLMIGPPGAGKTMLASRLAGILPAMSFEEALQTTRIYSLAGLLSEKYPFVSQRPFRSPHHTISDMALIGGGTTPKPGEVSLAHNGVLFLDEMLEFKKNVLEVLRQPLEAGYVSIARVLKSLRFPASFMMVAAMNPCPCGNLGDPVKMCTCSPYQVQRYFNKLSQPLLDRIDIHLQVPSLKIEEMMGKKDPVTSQDIRERVVQARRLQAQRFQKSNVFCNAQMTHAMVEEFCTLSTEERHFLQQVLETRKLSARAFFKILKLALTIADLENEKLNKNHLSQACQFRILDNREALWG